MTKDHNAHLGWVGETPTLNDMPADCEILCAYCGNKNCICEIPPLDPFYFD